MQTLTLPFPKVTFFSEQGIKNCQNSETWRKKWVEKKKIGVKEMNKPCKIQAAESTNESTSTAWSLEAENLAQGMSR